MKQLFTDILTQLQMLAFNTGTSTITPFIGVWNNQMQGLENGTYTTTLPAVYIEFVTNEVIVLSQGIESFDPLDIKIHIIDNLVDAGDGTQEPNLRIFDYKQQVYALLKGFEPTDCVKLFRVSETQDYDHDNLYHYIQTYRTNLIDNSMQLPVGGIVKEPVTGLTIDSSFAN